MVKNEIIIETMDLIKKTLAENKNGILILKNDFIY